MRKILSFVLCLTVLLSIMTFYSPVEKASSEETVKVWMSQVNSSNDGMSLALTPQADAVFKDDSGTNPHTINVDENVTYQQMDGFGASFTEASSYLVETKLKPEARTALMNSLFDKKTGIGISMLRQPIGACDHVISPYTYDPNKDTDELPNFSIDHDKAYIIPSIQQALSVNPGRIKVMAATWSPPGWMKANNSELGYANGIPGTLVKYKAYANYLTKFIKAYQDANIPIFATTIQNETDYASPNWPAMPLGSQEETNLINKYLYPAFKANNLTGVKIIGWDHNFTTDNYSDGQYAKDILSADKNNLLAGTAWHWYSSNMEPALMQVHYAFPNKDFWFTEGSGGEWDPVKKWHDGFKTQMEYVVRLPRLWSKSIVWWNVALDENNGPDYYYTQYQKVHSTCRGLVQIRQSDGAITYYPDYYTMGHISKFVDPGAYRIDSNTYENDIESVAFKNPDKSKVVIAYNENKSPKTIKVKWGSQSFSYTIPAEAAATFKWSGEQDRQSVIPVWFNNFENGKGYFAGVDTVVKLNKSGATKGGSRSVRLDVNSMQEPGPKAEYSSVRITPSGKGAMDISRYGYLNFYLKDITNEGDGDIATVAIVDTSNRAWTKQTPERSVFNKWKLMHLPLDGISGIDRTKIKEIRIAESNGGTYYIDDLYLSLGPDAVRPLASLSGKVEAESQQLLGGAQVYSGNGNLSGTSGVEFNNSNGEGLRLSNVQTTNQIKIHYAANGTGRLSIYKNDYTYLGDITIPSTKKMIGTCTYSDVILKGQSIVAGDSITIKNKGLQAGSIVYIDKVDLTATRK
jgi:glucosylceramidase